MEGAPLTKAHAHARCALIETKRSNPIAACEEHELAAAEFALAAETCGDVEASRLLHLMEQHHKRLADVIKFKREREREQSASKAQAEKNDAPAHTSSESSGTARTPSRRQSSSTPIVSKAGNSITSNLASARGIRQAHAQSPLDPGLQEAQHFRRRATDSPSRGSNTPGPSSHGQKTRVKPPWAPTVEPPSVDDNEKRAEKPRGTATKGKQPTNEAADEPFQRFYSTFEGLISKLSAPLAFTSLPLGIHTDGGEKKDSPASPKIKGETVTVGDPLYSSNLDMSRLISPAALRALRDGDKSRLPSKFKPMESFYVVPKSVGTASQRHRQLQQAEDDDGFVDALADPETSPTYQQSKGRNKLPRKTREELELENETLRSLSDDLAKRLHMWEINSQSSTMALHQSFRAMKQSQAFYTDPSSPPPLPNQYRQAKSSQPSQTQDHKGKSPASEQQPSSSEGDTHHAPDSLDARIKELEELVARERRELEQTKRENARLHKSMMRYKEQWDNLVNQARLRGLSRQQRRSSEGGGQRMEAVPEESQEEVRHDGAATTRSGSSASAEGRN